LLSEHPFDAINDVALARAVGPDDDRNSRGKFEPRLIGEALEAVKFEGFEHLQQSVGPRSLGSRLLRAEWLQFIKKSLFFGRIFGVDVSPPWNRFPLPRLLISPRAQIIAKQSRLGAHSPPIC